MGHELIDPPEAALVTNSRVSKVIVCEQLQYYVHMSEDSGISLVRWSQNVSMYILAIPPGARLSGYIAVTCLCTHTHTHTLL